MTCHKDWLQDVKPTKMNVSMSDDSSVQAIGKGTLNVTQNHKNHKNSKPTRQWTERPFHYYIADWATLALTGFDTY
jgi:hypothetical protein